MIIFPYHLKETYIYKGLPPLEEENTERKKVIMMVLGDHMEVGVPLIKEDILTKVRDPLTEENTLIEDLLEENILIEMGDPLEEDILAEDPLMMEDPLDLLVDKDQWALRDHLEQ